MPQFILLQHLFYFIAHETTPLCRFSCVIGVLFTVYSLILYYLNCRFIYLVFSKHIMCDLICICLFVRSLFFVGYQKWWIKMNIYIYCSCSRARSALWSQQLPACMAALPAGLALLDIVDYNVVRFAIYDKHNSITDVIVIHYQCKKPLRFIT